MIYAFLIINKSGGLIYNRDFGNGLAKLSSNEYLILADDMETENGHIVIPGSSIHAITAQLSPVPGCSGIEMLESDSFRLYCFQTLTGIKFILVTDPSHTNHEQHCRKLYEIYSDFVMKNAFYTPEMPIRAELFDLGINKYIKTIQ